MSYPRWTLANLLGARGAEAWRPAPDAGNADLGNAVAACVDAAMQLLTVDPATAADDPQVVRLAVRLGRAYLLGQYGTGNHPPALDPVLAWAAWAVAAGERLYGPGSIAVVDAACVLVRLLRRVRRFARAADVQRRITAGKVGRAGLRSAGWDMFASADLLQDAGLCARAAGRLDEFVRRWQRQPFVRRADRLHLAMSVAVRHAVCGRTGTARHYLAAAAPHRPRNPDRDYATVQLYYGMLASDRRDAHRDHCTWPADDEDFDFTAAMRR